MENSLQKLQKEIILNANDVDFQSTLSIPAIMRHFQVIAAEHTQILEIDHHRMIDKSNAFWVITKIKIKILRLPKWGEKVIIKTWPLLPSAVKCNRDFEFISLKGEKLVLGISEWCLLDTKNRNLRRVSSTIYPLDFIHLERRSFDPNYNHFPNDYNKEDLLYLRKIRSSDLDLNIHTNNTVYSNMVMDSFSTSELTKRGLASYEIHFKAESREGDLLEIYRKEIDEKVGIFGLDQNTRKIIFEAGIKYRN